MRIVDLFMVATMPVLKVLLITALGSFLAIDRFDILGEVARERINKVVFYVFNPALVVSNLAKTVTFDSFLSLWFMPVNILITFLIGSALGWILTKVTRAPLHLKGLIVGSCAAGNLGNLPLIILPAVCKEKGSPFGASDTCQSYGLAYASLSMAIGAIYIWTYVYNIVRISSSQIIERAETNGTAINGQHNEATSSSTGPHLSKDSLSIAYAYISSEPSSAAKSPLSYRIMHRLRNFAVKMNIKSVFTPSTCGAIAGFVIGMIPPIRRLLIGSDAPLHVVEDSASLIGDAAIPTVTLIVGGNLLRGLKGSGIQPAIVAGIVAVRYVFLPLLGTAIVKGAIRFGFVQDDPLYQFVLLLQYAVPPAINIGTITQLFGTGQNECSVILLWAYALASVSLTLWSTLFLWLVS